MGSAKPPIDQVIQTPARARPQSLPHRARPPRGGQAHRSVTVRPSGWSDHRAFSLPAAHRVGQQAHPAAPHVQLMMSSHTKALTLIQSGCVGTAPVHAILEIQLELRTVCYTACDHRPLLRFYGLVVSLRIAPRVMPVRTYTEWCAELDIGFLVQSSRPCDQPSSIASNTAGDSFRDM